MGVKQKISNLGFKVHISQLVDDVAHADPLIAADGKRYHEVLEEIKSDAGDAWSDAKCFYAIKEFSAVPHVRTARAISFIGRYGNSEKVAKYALKTLAANGLRDDPSLRDLLQDMVKIVLLYPEIAKYALEQLSFKSDGLFVWKYGSVAIQYIYEKGLLPDMGDEEKNELTDLALSKSFALRPALDSAKASRFISDVAYFSICKNGASKVPFVFDQVFAAIEDLESSEQITQVLDDFVKFLCLMPEYAPRVVDRLIDSEKPAAMDFVHRVVKYAYNHGSEGIEDYALETLKENGSEAAIAEFIQVRKAMSSGFSVLASVVILHEEFQKKAGSTEPIEAFKAPVYALLKDVLEPEKLKELFRQEDGEFVQSLKGAFDRIGQSGLAVTPDGKPIFLQDFVSRAEQKIGLDKEKALLAKREENLNSEIDSSYNKVFSPPAND